MLHNIHTMQVYVMKPEKMLGRIHIYIYLHHTCFITYTSYFITYDAS
jgi:hypothetical protein